MLGEKVERSVLRPVSRAGVAGSRRRAEFIRSHRRVPSAFAAVVDACLEPDPAERPTVKDLMQILNQLA